MRQRQFHIVVGLACLALACGGTDEPVQGPGWSIGDEVLVIGREESRAGHTLFRVAGAIRYDDGTLLVADGGSGELRVFDGTGSLLRTFGAAGDGPGESRAITGIWRAAQDTVVTYDPVLSRLSYWSIEDGFLDQFTIERGPLVLDASSESILAVHMEPAGLDAAFTTRLDSAEIAELSRTDGARRPVLRRPWQVHLTTEAPGGQLLGMPHPLEPRGVAAYGEAGDVWVGFPRDWSVTRVGRSGQPEDTLSLPLKRRPFTPELRAVWDSTNLQNVADAEQAAMREYLASIPYPDSLPAYDRFVIDGEGQLWLRQFTVAGEAESTWYIAAASGRAPASLRMPSAARLLQAGADYILVAVTPATRGEEVILYELNR